MKPTVTRRPGVNAIRSSAWARACCQWMVGWSPAVAAVAGIAAGATARAALGAATDRPEGGEEGAAPAAMGADWATSNTASPTARTRWRGGRTDGADGTGTEDLGSSDR